MISFYVPSGIGDFSAMYAVLCKVPRDMGIMVTQDGPQRLGPFLDILPRVKNEGYGQFGTYMTLNYSLPPKTDLMSLVDGQKYFLSINNWLENGKRVADWMDYEPDYHYRMNISDNMKDLVKETLGKLEGNPPLIGVYTTAYGNSRHWGFWGPQEWYVFLQAIRKVVPPSSVFVFIGAEYDMGISDIVYGACQRDGIPSIFTLGNFHIGSTIELIRQLDYFFIFPSGLGFLSDVVETPHMMWFPPNLDAMRYTFTDPRWNGTQTLHLPFMDPAAAAAEFLKHGQDHFLERILEKCQRRSSTNLDKP